METEPLISVIVPIYNVELYVRKCLDSLKNQTMKEIEIICIDDGSTDNSGVIADEYLSDEKFRVIHTENRGLSAARNRGIEESKAPWIMFVDSDDWVDRDFCKVPYETAIRENADLVIFEWNEVKRGRIRRKRRNSYSIGVISEDEAHEYGEDVAWNKLYRSMIFLSNKYPVGRVFEDVATTHKLVHCAKRIIRLDDSLYYHTYRKTSISHSKTNDFYLNLCESQKEKFEDFISYGYLNEDIKPFMCSVALSVLFRKSAYDEETVLKAKSVIDRTKGIPKMLNNKKKIALIAYRVIV